MSDPYALYADTSLSSSEPSEGGYITVTPDASGGSSGEPAAYLHVSAANAGVPGAVPTSELEADQAPKRRDETYFTKPRGSVDATRGLSCG
jgi:hypothetical protein